MGRVVARDRAPSPGFASAVASSRRHLLAENKSARTIETYLDGVARLGRFLSEHGMPTAPMAVTREHVETFVADQLARFKPATAHTRYKAVRAFCK